MNKMLKIRKLKKKDFKQVYRLIKSSNETDFTTIKSYFDKNFLKKVNKEKNGIISGCSGKFENCWCFNCSRMEIFWNFLPGDDFRGPKFKRKEYRKIPNKKISYRDEKQKNKIYLGPRKKRR